MGAVKARIAFGSLFFDKVTILPFTREANKTAVEIYRQLKSENKLIEIADILIAATALANGLKLVTLNKSHFERIQRIKLLDRK